MYPNTRLDIFDESDIQQIRTVEEYKPLFLCAASTDKGPEELMEIDRNFKRRFGEISFARHGQALLQADAILEAGGKILFKRMVSPDAKLANIMIVANVRKDEIQKTNAAGQLLYLHTVSGLEVIDPLDATPIMVDAAIIRYDALSVENLERGTQLKVHADTLYSETEDVDGWRTYPLFGIYDNGRGVSNKKFRISPDYDGSKNIDFLRYQIDIMENNQRLETSLFSFDPEKVYFERAFSLESVVNSGSVQVKARMFDEYIKAFVKFVTESATIPADIESILNEDIVFGTRRTSKEIDTIIIDAASVNMSNPFGVSLENGTNGIFGESPVSTPEYVEALTDFFNGDMDDSIYDRVKYPIEAVVDANYPAEVKRAIESFVTFREDVFYFGDMGIVNTVEQMKNLMHISAKNKFTSYTHLSYDIIDPYTKKQITVTAGYDLARILVNHFKTGRNRPVAGTLNDAVLSSAIEGTVNYLPKETPKVNQKQELDDIRVCYGGYIGGQLVLETQYTSQTRYSQLSFINNMLAMQEIIRAVRARCPITRYSFIDGEDLETYKNDVQAVLNRYTTNFAVLEFEYIEDEIMVQNKIFYAAIRVKFRNYVQAEHFKIFAIQ